MPIVSTRPARPGSVNAALISTISATTSSRLNASAMQATTPAKR